MSKIKVSDDMKICGLIATDMALTIGVVFISMTAGAYLGAMNLLKIIRKEANKK